MTYADPWTGQTYSGPQDPFTQQALPGSTLNPNTELQELQNEYQRKAVSIAPMIADPIAQLLRNAVGGATDLVREAGERIGEAARGTPTPSDSPASTGSTRQSATSGGAPAGGPPGGLEAIFALLEESAARKRKAVDEETAGLLNTLTQLATNNRGKIEATGATAQENVEASRETSAADLERTQARQQEDAARVNAQAQSDAAASGNGEDAKFYAADLASQQQSQADLIARLAENDARSIDRRDETLEAVNSAALGRLIANQNAAQSDIEQRRVQQISEIATALEDQKTQLQIQAMQMAQAAAGRGGGGGGRGGGGGGGGISEADWQMALFLTGGDEQAAMQLIATKEFTGVSGAQELLGIGVEPSELDNIDRLIAGSPDAALRDAVKLAQGGSLFDTPYSSEEAAQLGAYYDYRLGLEQQLSGAQNAPRGGH